MSDDNAILELLDAEENEEVGYHNHRGGKVKTGLYIAPEGVNAKRRIKTELNKGNTRTKQSLDDYFRHFKKLDPALTRQMNAASSQLGAVTKKKYYVGQPTTKSSQSTKRTSVEETLKSFKHGLAIAHRVIDGEKAFQTIKDTLLQSNDQDIRNYAKEYSYTLYNSHPDATEAVEFFVGPQYKISS